MKKSIATLAILLCSVAAIVAQPRAIGVRLGYNLEASYQHGLGESGFLQADAGVWYSFRAGQATLTYNHILAQPNWTSYGEWCFSVGGGIGAGYYWGYRGYRNIWLSNYRYGWAGVVPVVQLAFKFEFPLQISVDYRPNIGVKFYGEDYYGYYGNRIRYNTEGLFDVALSVRYTF